MKKDSIFGFCKVTAVLACASVALTSAHATTITLNMSSPYYLGDAVPALPESDADEATYINAMNNGITSVTLPGHVDAINRSGNFAIGTLPTANSSAAVSQSGPFSLSQMNFGTGYTYLFAYYGNSTVPGLQQVGFAWDVSGLAGDYFTIDTQGLSHWELFNPGGNPPSRVPDGASTAELLGGALVAMGLLRRKFCRL
jgi:hypothetical protein